MKLILGIEKPTSGDIKINEKNIKDIKKSDIRKKISYIGQEDFMFSDTIYNNLDLYEGNSIDTIIEYAKMTNLDNFVQEQNLKYASYINENGENLSKGQRQSLAITRALIRNPQLIILDEATSNLDKVKEEKIMNNIFSMNIPCIVITHDKSILDKMDLVIQI